MERADSVREIISIPHNELTNELFDHLWAREDPYPIIVTPIPGQKLLQYPWTPEFFARVTGNTECDAQDCETGDIVRTTVGAFYSLFGKEDDARRVVKLKVFTVPPSHCTLRIWTHSTLASFALGLPFLKALPDYSSLF
jgi:hypothetical protein